jgi:hypothetical protein
MGLAAGRRPFRCYRLNVEPGIEGAAISGPSARQLHITDNFTLIGDTEEMVRRHYARWVPERQERLTRILREKLAGVPTPKLASGPRLKLAVIGKRA